jgi:hypothetical protein
MLNKVLAPDIPAGTPVPVDAQITQLCDHRGPGHHFLAIAPNGGSAAMRPSGRSRGLSHEYAAALGPHTRWGSPAKVYRAAGLPPAIYASAGQRHDRAISREGSVHLRRALLGLGIGLWQRDPAARRYATSLRERGKPGGIIACALARRAGKIAFAISPRPSPLRPRPLELTWTLLHNHRRRWQA